MDRICHLFEARRRFLHAAAAVLALVAWPLATEAKDRLLGETVELSGAVLFAETKVPALVLGVVRNGETSVFGFGKIGPADDRAPDGKSLLRIGSITKAFTGAVLASLVGDGVVKLTDPLQARLGWNGANTDKGRQGHPADRPRHSYQRASTRSRAPARSSGQSLRYDHKGNIHTKPARRSVAVCSPRGKPSLS